MPVHFAVILRTRRSGAVKGRQTTLTWWEKKVGGLVARVSQKAVMLLLLQSTTLEYSIGSILGSFSDDVGDDDEQGHSPLLHTTSDEDESEGHVLVAKSDLLKDEAGDVVGEVHGGGASESLLDT
jgi:hypothetical protein